MLLKCIICEQFLLKISKGTHFVGRQQVYKLTWILTLLLRVQVALNGWLAVHFADLGWMLHSLHQLLHLLTSALEVVPRLQITAKQSMLDSYKKALLQLPEVLTRPITTITTHRHHHHWVSLSSVADHILQAELQLLLIGHKVLSHLHRQVVEC